MTNFFNNHGSILHPLNNAAVGIYGMRKIVSTYNGPIVQVINLNDSNKVVDLYFDEEGKLNRIQNIVSLGEITGSLAIKSYLYTKGVV